MFTAVTNQGDIFFQFVKGYSNEASVAAFFVELSKALDHSKPNWRSNHLLLLDNCSTHKTDTVTRLISRLSIPTMYSAPASYLVAPIERLFVLATTGNGTSIHFGMNHLCLSHNKLYTLEHIGECDKLSNC
jgi:hypothetical protein